MSITELVHEYVESSLASLKASGLMKLPSVNVPKEMRDDSITPQDDWVGWKAMPSTVTERDLDSIEQEINLRFPPAYRIFLRYKHFCELGGPIRFFPHPIHTWKKILFDNYRVSWEPERIIGVGLIPFAEETLMDAGPVCFDTRYRLPNGDCPIIFWDSEWIETDKETNPLFSNSVAMFGCLTFAAQQEINFIHHYDDDDSDLLPKKRTLMKQFLELDAEGAGRAAKEYWTAWGVEP